MHTQNAGGTAQDGANANVLAPSIAVLIGSVRARSRSAEIAKIVGDVVRQRTGNAVHLDWFDPRAMDLRLPHAPGAEVASTSLAAELQARVRRAAGLILVTPEYDGSYSAAMKLMLEHLGYPSAMGGKPVAIIGIAAGQIGATRAVEHLRAVVFHSGGVVVPGTVSLANVQHLLGSDGLKGDAAARIEALVERFLGVAVGGTSPS